MSDDDNWHWWQTYAATGGIAAAAIVFGKYYTEEKERAEAKTALLLTASNKLKDSTVIITGANTGVGYAAATMFAESGAKVILACRNPTKGMIAAAKIRYQTNNPNVSFDQVDLSDFRSIEAFADRQTKCHVLVNNAGEILASKTLKYGLETTVLTNYVGPWYLTKLMIPKLLHTASQDHREVRIVNVCSRAEKYSELGPDFIQSKEKAFEKLFNGPEPHQPFLAYSNSKLADLLFHFELARKLTTPTTAAGAAGAGPASVAAAASAASAQLICTAVTPGFANTNIFKFVPRYMTSLTAPLRYATLKSAADGGSELVYAAIADKAHGVYFGEQKPTYASDFAKNKELSGALWEYTDKVVKEIIKGERK